MKRLYHFYPFFPYLARGGGIPRLDQSGIYVVCSTGLLENLEAGTTVDYGINPCVWRALPTRSIVLWKVRHPVSEAGASLPVMVVVPSGGNSTVATGSGTSKIPLVDNKGTQVTGGDVTNPTGTAQPVGNTTEHIVYIDKSAGIFRLLGVTASAGAEVLAAAPASPATRSTSAAR